MMILMSIPLNVSFRIMPGSCLLPLLVALSLAILFLILGLISKGLRRSRLSIKLLPMLLILLESRLLIRFSLLR